MVRRVVRAVFRLGCGAAAVLALAGLARSQPAELSPAEVARLHRLIKPQPGEAKWSAIPWLTNLEEARRRAAELDRPLFVWRAGGGEVLGRA